ncbi:unnamed protein product [Diplocarpon coronariae]
MNSANAETPGAGAELRQTESISISPELFAKLFLSPGHAAKGDLRKTFANPPPLSVLSFISHKIHSDSGTVHVPVCCYRITAIPVFTSLDICKQGLVIGVNSFSGGLLLLVSGILDFFPGNTFPSVVSMSSSSSAFYALFVGLLPFIFLICSLRTNAIFVLVSMGASLGFCLAAASLCCTASGLAVGPTLLKGAGARGVLCGGHDGMVSISSDYARDAGFAAEVG